MLVSGVFAQRTCSSHNIFKQQLAADPAFAKKQQEIEAFTQRCFKNGTAISLSFTARGTVVYTIPVVVHVVYKTALQNITDAQVQSQIDILNKDYEALNSDTALVPSVFKPLIADCKIRFCLARQDPGGNATTGILHVPTTKSSFTDNDSVKRASSGGDNAWDASRYLNLWVCNLSGGLLGYAQFPGGPAATDGVVVLYTAFGNTGTATAPYDKGRTATHEIGHWLNLRHIWGDDDGACTGSDLVGDTPNAADANYGCPSFPHVTCSNGPDGDLFMNYMDYSDDACMQLFTPGQRDRMYAVLQAGGARASITTSQGCTAPGGGCGTPAGFVASNIKQTSATVSWGTVSGAKSYDLQYKAATAPGYTTIAGLTATSYSLTGLTASTTYYFQVRASCASGNGNYSSASSFITAAVPLICSDNYEPNNTKAAAKAIAVNTNVTGFIAAAGDLDFFSFTTTSAARNIKVTLSSLPKDYDLLLLNAAGSQIGISQKSGTAGETITYNGGAAGTYKVEVYGYSGAYDAASCYTLNVIASSNSLKETSDHVIDVKGGVIIYPQPAATYTDIQFGSEWKGMATLTVTNSLGQMLGVKPINTESRFYRLDVSGLVNGLYYINISNGHATVTRKIIVQR